MSVKFLKYAFGVDGDKTPIPNTTQGDGSVSYQEGFGFDYERDASDPLVKDVPRDEFNELMFDITAAIQQYQTHGTPDFITSSDNDGTAYSYDINAQVLFDDGSGVDIYTSLQGSNTAMPTDATKWRKGNAVGITNLTGDVVADGPGSVPATIQNNAVTTPKINAKAVTYAKFQDVPAYSVLVNLTNASGQVSSVALTNKQMLGFGDATTGTFGAISIGTGLDIVGNQLVNTQTINNARLAAAWATTSSSGGVGTGYNIASISSISGGTSLNVAFTTPMPSSNYLVIATAGNTGNTAGGVCIVRNRTTTGFTLFGTQSANDIDILVFSN